MIMKGHISKTLFKNGDIRYFINMKCVDCGHELYGFYEEHIDINKCPECSSDKIRTFNPDIE